MTWAAVSLKEIPGKGIISCGTEVTDFRTLVGTLIERFILIGRDDICLYAKVTIQSAVFCLNMS